MADNVTVTPGSGTTIATDEKNYGSGPVQVQLVALVSAADGDTSRSLVDANGNLLVMVSGLKTSGKVTNLDLTQNAAAVQAVGTPLANRSSVLIYNESDVTIRVGFINTVTATSPNRGLPIPSGQSYTLDIGTIACYLFAPTGGAAGVKPVTIVEIA